jgi:amino acid transporter
VTAKADEIAKTVSDPYKSKHGDLFLAKELRWWDGFILALAVPIYLFPDLGASAVKLGVIACIAVWMLSVIIGALQTSIYVELALMFPHKSGSLPSWAQEAWKRYTPLVGPFVAWAYWAGWCVVLAINGLLVGEYLRAAAFPSADPVRFPQIVGTMLLVVLAGIDIIGLKTAKWVRYVLGFMVMVPILIIMFGAYLSGQFSTDHLQPLGIPGGRGTWAGFTIFMYWLYLAGWSSYAFEAVAVHAPEYKYTMRDTPIALHSSAIFSIVVYSLVPLGLIATLGLSGIAADTLTPFDKALKTILGANFGTLIVFFVIAALILAAQMSAVASVRALWQMAKNGLTVTGFSMLNRSGSPYIAVLFTYGFNILIIWTIGTPIWILVASNVGYISAHIITLGGYLLLRRDQPNAVRPIKRGPAWVYLAGALLIVNLVAMIISAFGLAGEDAGWSAVFGPWPFFAGLGTIIVLAFGLYAWRTYMQPNTRVAAELTR